MLILFLANFTAVVIVSAGTVFCPSLVSRAECYIVLLSPAISLVLNANSRGELGEFLFGLPYAGDEEMTEESKELVLQ